MLEAHTVHKPGVSELVDTRQSNDSDKTVSLSGSNSTDSERTPVRVDSVDGETNAGELRWPRQNSVSNIFVFRIELIQSDKNIVIL